MYRLIKIPADMSLPIVPVETPDLEFNTLAGLIGDETFSDTYLEQVRPRGLTKLTDDMRLVLLVDEDGHSRQLPINLRASYLYGTHVHGQPILGEALVCSEVETEEGWDWAALPEALTPYHMLNAVFLSAMDTETFKG